LENGSPANLKELTNRGAGRRSLPGFQRFTSRGQAANGPSVDKAAGHAQDNAAGAFDAVALEYSDESSSGLGSVFTHTGVSHRSGRRKASEVACAAREELNHRFAQAVGAMESDNGFVRYP
jgi:hypothetical protein